MESIHPLKAYRESQKPRLTQKQLADLLGVKKATVSRWETGSRRLDETKLTAVAEKTGIAPEDLRPDLAELFKQPETAAP